MSGADSVLAAPLRIGLAEGEGTGAELAAVFRRALAELARGAGISYQVADCPQRFRTYGGLRAAGLSHAAVQAAAAEDAAVYEEYLRDFWRLGGRVVFRTAINAESLYRARERLCAVKLDRVELPGARLVLVRDEAQGFYGGVNSSAADRDHIVRTCEFRRDVTERLIAFAVAAGAEAFGGRSAIDRVLLVYKFHLLDTRFLAWVDAAAAGLGMRCEIYQPDSMNRLLLRGEIRGNVVVLGSNEWGDVMHAELLARSDSGTAHEEACSENVFLDPAVAGLIEIQTVHGSADDVAGRGIANPGATLRAAARALARHPRGAMLPARMDAAIRGLAARGLATPDRGGSASTADVCDAVLGELLGPRVRSAAGG